MPRRRKQPKYRLHKASGQAVVTINGKDHYLGAHQSPESHREYADWIAKWRSQCGLPADPESKFENLSINEVLEKCWHDHFSSYYSEDGKPTKEALNLLHDIQTVRQLCGMSLAREFGPRKLKEIRRHMIEVQNLARTEINKRIGRIKRIFKHAVSEELVPASVYHALQSVSGLREGKCNARESKAVKPVSDLWVCLVLPFVSRQVAAMILLQRITGMRSGEVCIMRPREINSAGTVWEYRPFRHKNQWRGHERVVPLGPFAQRVLETFINRDLDAFLFSPKEAEAERNAARRQNRQTASKPSQQNRSAKSKPKRAKRDQFDTDSYRRAITYGMKKAKRTGIIIPHWHPHQLRHTHGTEVRAIFGIEEARTSLGTCTDVVEIYAERNLALATEVAAKIG